METIVICSGGYDPIHQGHISYFNAAKALGDKLIVAVNSDNWLTRKKGRAFMPFQDRIEIVRNLKSVDAAMSFNDDDNSAKDAIRQVLERYPNDKIIFANGGDRTSDNIPEMEIEDPRIEFVFGVGGQNKANSSSWILQEWKAPKTVRPWGYYRVLHEVPGVKVKELTVNPGHKLSMQRHFKRAEYWLVSEGSAVVNLKHPKFNDTTILHQHEDLHIATGDWHQLCNTTDKPLRIVEIQYGKDCIEEDIERV